MSDPYRHLVPTIFCTHRRSRTAALLGALLSVAFIVPTYAYAQGGPQVGEAPGIDASAIVPDVPDVGNPQLAALLRKGLTSDTDLGCALTRLQIADEAEGRHARRLGTRIGKLFRPSEAPALVTARETRVRLIAERRLNLAERIALTYLDVRRLQRRADLRRRLIDQYRDNAEIADFRREAGLVPTIDSALARSQNETVRAELGEDEAELADALAKLAALVGEEPSALAGEIRAAGTEPVSSAKTQNALPGATASPDADSGNKRLSAQRELAARTVRDARAAYREGVGNIATLYVAEAAALALDQALVDQQSRQSAAELRRLLRGDAAWATGGLAPSGKADAKTVPAKDMAGRCD